MMTAEVERRYAAGRLEVRAGPGGKPRIAGYAVMYSRRSRNLGGFVEEAAPTAFRNSAGRGWPDVICRYNHDMNYILGTIAGGTLELDGAGPGLFYDVLPPDSRADVAELVARGDVLHSSFAFRTPAGGDDWGVTDQSYPLRTLRAVDLVDVAPVVDPAYPDATAGLRSLAARFGADLAEVRSMAEADELRRFFIRTDNRGPAIPERRGTLGAVALTGLMARREPGA